MIDLPDLPEHSRLRVEAADTAIRVWWRFRPRGVVAGIGDVFLATALLAGGGLAYFSLALHFEDSKPDWRFTAAMLLTAVIVLGLGGMVFHKFHLPKPESVKLTTEELAYGLPGDPAADTASALSNWPDLRIPRGRIRAMVAASFGGIPALRLEADGSFLWIGLRLSQSDIEWLVEVLTRWKEHGA